MKFIKRVFLLVLILGALGLAYVASKIKVETNVVMPEMPKFNFFNEKKELSSLPPPTSLVEPEDVIVKEKIECMID